MKNFSLTRHHRKRRHALTERDLYTTARAPRHHAKRTRPVVTLETDRRTRHTRAQRNMDGSSQASLRASQVPAFRVMEVMKAAHERERAGGKVLHMEVGQPSVGAPSAVLDAAKASLDACARGETTLGYTVADGTDALVRWFFLCFCCFSAPYPSTSCLYSPSLRVSNHPGSTIGPSSVPAPRGHAS